MVISTLEMAEAQERLVAAIADMDDEAMQVASRCTGWTRGHVLSHIARNADGMVNLARWAQTGEETPMYPSSEVRNREIEEGSLRPSAQIIADVVATNERILAAFGALEGRVAVDPAVAAFEVGLGAPPAARSVPVRDLPFLRLQEVVVHHHDLADGLRARDWPRAYVDEALPRVAAIMADRVQDMPTLVAEDDDVVRTVTPDGADVTVRAPAAALLVWLLGRSTEEDRARMDVAGGDLPDLPAY